MPPKSYYLKNRKDIILKRRKPEQRRDKTKLLANLNLWRTIGSEVLVLPILLGRVMPQNSDMQTAIMSTMHNLKTQPSSQPSKGSPCPIRILIMGADSAIPSKKGKANNHSLSKIDSLRLKNIRFRVSWLRISIFIQKSFLLHQRFPNQSLIKLPLLLNTNRFKMK